MNSFFIFFLLFFDFNMNFYNAENIILLMNSSILNYILSPSYLIHIIIFIICEIDEKY